MIGLLFIYILLVSESLSLSFVSVLFFLFWGLMVVKMLFVMNNFLSILLVFECMFLALISMMSCVFSGVVFNPLTILMMYVFSVVEASLGLGLLVNFSRSFGNDQLKLI